MADPVIRLKRSAVAGKRPTLANVELGEVALNTYDGNLFARQDTGGVGIATTVALLTPWQEEYGAGSISYSGDVKVGSAITFYSSSGIVSAFTGSFENFTIADTLTIGNQIIYAQGFNGFSVNEDFDPSNVNYQTAYHYTSGAGRSEVAFTLARTGQFTNGFGIYGTAANNTFVSFGEQSNTSWEWRRNVGIRPLDLDGGTLLMKLSSDGNLGIGTNVQSDRLVIVGNSKVSGSLTATDLTATSLITATNINATGIVSSTDGRLIAGVGISSGGTYIGSGVTAFNFVGASVTNVTVPSAGLSTISIDFNGLTGIFAKTENKFSATEGQTSFSVGYEVGYVDVFLNGVRLNSDNFTATDGSTVGLTSAADAGDAVDIIVYEPQASATPKRVVTNATATAGQTAFTVPSYDTGTNSMDVFLNGIKLDSAEFTETDGTTVTLAVGAALNDELQFISYESDNNFWSLNGSTLHRTSPSNPVAIGTITEQGVLTVQDGGPSGASKAATSDGIVLDANKETGINILTPNNTAGNIRFGDPQDNSRFYVEANHNTDTFTIGGPHGTIKLDADGIDSTGACIGLPIKIQRASYAPGALVNLYSGTNTDALAFFSAFDQTISMTKSGNSLVVNLTGGMIYAGTDNADAFTMYWDITDTSGTVSYDGGYIATFYRQLLPLGHTATFTGINTSTALFRLGGFSRYENRTPYIDLRNPVSNVNGNGTLGCPLRYTFIELTA